MKQILLVRMIQSKRPYLNRVIFFYSRKIHSRNSNIIDLPITDIETEVNNYQGEDLFNALLNKEQDEIGEIVLYIKEYTKCKFYRYINATFSYK
jgi:hypothetical protein